MSARLCTRVVRLAGEGDDPLAGGGQGVPIGRALVGPGQLFELAEHLGGSRLGVFYGPLGLLTVILAVRAIEIGQRYAGDSGDLLQAVRLCERRSRKILIDKCSGAADTVGKLLHG